MSTSAKRESERWLLYPAGWLLVVWALVHSLRTRTMEDYIRHSLYLAVFLVAIFLSLLVLRWRHGSVRPLYSWLAELFILIIVSPIFGVVYYSIGAAVKDAYLWIQSPIPSKNEAVIAAIALTLLLGGILFYFRLKLRSVYGLTEAAVGLAVAGQRVSAEIGSATQNPAFYLALLTAGVYLVVRGLDNIHQGATKDPIDPVATKLLNRFGFVLQSKVANGAG